MHTSRNLAASVGRRPPVRTVVPSPFPETSMEKPSTVQLDQIAIAAAQSVSLATADREALASLYEPNDPGTMGMFPTDPTFGGV